MSLRTQPASFEFWSLFSNLASEIGRREWGLSLSYNVCSRTHQNTPKYTQRLFSVTPFLIQYATTPDI